MIYLSCIASGAKLRFASVNTYACFLLNLNSQFVCSEDLYVILELSAGIREASGPPSPLEKEDLKLPQFERPECYLVQTRDNQAVMYNQRRRVWRDWRMFDLKFDSDPV